MRGKLDVRDQVRICQVAEVLMVEAEVYEYGVGEKELA